MFHVEVIADSYRHRVIDADTGVYLQWLVAGGPYFTEVFQLVHPGGVIPFSTHREHGDDPDTGLPFFVFRFITFGSAPRAHTNTKHLINCTFPDAVSKQFWMTVAAEALVVFGSAYNGLRVPNRRYTRVELNDGIFTLEDFGYELSAG
jgi:hypothetical protein